MFTGIVQGVACVEAVVDLPGLRQLSLHCPQGFADGVQVGASIAVDGVCLTLNAPAEEGRVRFDVMEQTLRVTTLGRLQPGARVNVERAAREGAEIGGHVLSGHVDDTVRLLAVERSAHNHVLRIGFAPRWRDYLFDKGYIALNGASLTLARVDHEAGWFEVWLIPETLRMTVFAEKMPGDALNLEVERSTQVIVDTVRRLVDARLAPFLPLLERLEHGASPT